ncbi:diacylglycerol kinase family protein [Streptomyces flavovariabilis]|uniref:diacylglycerol kinase family protein n=1 Tax=Streptomyces flavovariabilis TaxID=284031 RepID=UPI002277187C|nr:MULTISPECIES: diacylglycerol kinase family protein [Streptomyces]
MVPAGTRNHFARDLGLDLRDPGRALDALVDGEPAQVDLGGARLACLRQQRLFRCVHRCPAGARVPGGQASRVRRSGTRLCSGSRPAWTHHGGPSSGLLPHHAAR